MEKKVCEVLENRGGSYILPFFWQHGESKEILRDYMDAIEKSNIREVCLECRPHPDFCGPGWWRDMDVIMEEARKRKMGVWLLDDSHFPTGYANGGFKSAEPELCKQYIQFVTSDVHGMTHSIEFRAADAIREQRKTCAGGGLQMPGLEIPERRYFDTDEIWEAVAYKIVKGDVLGEYRDITDCLQDGVITWDVPEGMWRIFVIYYTQNAGGRTDYMNVLNKNSVRVLLEQVYEPVYEHYKDDFGKTFRGFFSDEPLVGNCANQYDDNTFIGKRRMPFPWSEEMPGLLEEQLGADWMRFLPCLWDNNIDKTLTGRIRYAYMNAMTCLIEKNFSMQIGNWCQDHGVEYIGHIVEDQNRSATVNYLGDYFRALKGQHMAGIDVIGGGIIPGGENRIAGGPYQPDGDFYHFMLAKLGVSLAHIDERKKGRTMVELFGAYGWDFGVKNMKYLADHFLVRGVNRFTPHAFSPKEFPDPDCPPHFYAHGENPQYRFFGRLMGYIQRTAHLLDGGLHIAPAALLHSGMASWSGEQMDSEKPARELAENQIDYDVIPPDILSPKKAFLEDGKLHINGECYLALIIPAVEFVNKIVDRFCREAAEQGFPVFFIDKKPEFGADYELKEELPGEIVRLEKLADILKENALVEIQLEPACADIRYYHYRLENDIYLFSNESMGNRYQGTVKVPVKGEACIYDAMDNVLRPVQAEETTEGTLLYLDLKPYEMIIVVFSKPETALIPRAAAGGEKTVLRDFVISICEAKEYPDFHDEMQLSAPANIGKFFPDFSGFIRYETEFILADKGDTEKYILSMEDAYECVEIWCNDRYIGSKICPEYIFDLTKAVRSGKNRLRMEVATTLVRKVQAMKGIDFGPFFRKSYTLEPLGIIGEVALWKSDGKV